MKKALLPLNLGLLVPTPQQLAPLRQVTSLDIFEGPGGNFHEDGLFSVLTFGRVGDPERDRRFGYIALKLPVLHPVIYSRLIKLKGLYGEILAGTRYATFNPELGDFEPANELTGQTGYHFFVEHWDQLRPAKTGSSVRDLRVELIEKYRDTAFMNNLLVLPAGLRDADIDVDGRVSMDDVNELYQGILMLVRNLPDGLNPKHDLSPYDRTRYSLTLKLDGLYKHLERLLSGKKGFIQSRWASRRVFNGTRNVFSSLDTSAVDLAAPNRPRFNDTVIGIYQAAKAFLPKTLYYLRNSVVGEVFDTSSNNVELVDPKTLKRTWVEVTSDVMDRWGTPEGLEKVLNELEAPKKRSRPIEIAGHYLALVYADNSDNFRILRSIDELPEHLDPKHVHPMTFVELVYLSGYREWNTHAGFVTRYPIENYNSSYPCKAYVKTTIIGEMRYELGPDFERLGDDYVALEFPKYAADGDVQYHDSLSVNPARLDPLTAD